MLDLSVGDGKTCMVAIKRNASLIGVCFNDDHKDALYARLEAEVFNQFQKADSKLYEPALANILGGQKKRKAAEEPHQIGYVIILDLNYFGLEFRVYHYYYS